MSYNYQPRNPGAKKKLTELLDIVVPHGGIVYLKSRELADVLKLKTHVVAALLFEIEGYEIKRWSRTGGSVNWMIRRKP